MDSRTPLLPTTASLPIATRRKQQLVSTSAPSSPLCPLPEDGELSSPFSPSLASPSSSLKDRLIFWPSDLETLNLASSDPLLPTTASLPIAVRRKQQFVSTSAPSSPLCPLPEDGELSSPFSPSLVSPSSSLKDRLIFGPSDPETLTLTLNLASSDPPPSGDLSADDPSWLSKHNLHRSRTAPSMASIDDVAGDSATVRHHSPPPPPPNRTPIVRQAVILLSIYLSIGVAIYTLSRSSFAGDETHPVVDALYFCIVTMCTIGYGDITPTTPSAKLYSIAFVLIGFGFVHILLTAMLSRVLDLQESLLLAAVKHGESGSHHHRKKKRNYIVDVKKGRMRIRMKVVLALGVVVLCVGVGTAFLYFVERLGLLDSFYLSVISVTTVGYGDRAFKTMHGRLFASIWLLVSTLTVTRAFVYLAEARIHRRHRKFAEWMLSQDLTVSEFLAADIDNNGFVSKSEFVIYKLKKMEKIKEKEILQICDQFDRIDVGKFGRITLSGLVASHHQ